MSSQEKKWLFKLEEDIDLGMPTAWSGFVRCGGTRADARRAIAKKLFVKRLPANTIVMSQDEIVAGKQPRRVTNKKEQPSKQFAKTVAEVGPSFDDVQDMLEALKKQGLI